MLSGDDDGDGGQPFVPVPSIIKDVEELPMHLNAQMLGFSVGFDTNGDNKIIVQMMNENEGVLAFFTVSLQHWEEFYRHFVDGFSNAVDICAALAFPTLHGEQ